MNNRVMGNNRFRRLSTAVLVQNKLNSTIAESALTETENEVSTTRPVTEQKPPDIGVIVLESEREGDGFRPP